MPSGRSASISGSAARTPSETSSGLAVACLTMPIVTEGVPPKKAALRSSRAPSSTRATFLSRTGKPSTSLTTISPNCSGVVRLVCDRTVNSRLLLSIRPDGISTFCARSAASTSCTVMS